MKLFLLLLLLLPSVLFAQAAPADLQYRTDGETLINPSFEQGKKGYTFTVGSGTATWATQTTTKLTGAAMQLTLSAQTFNFKSATTQGSGFQNQKGYAEVYLSASTDGAEFCPLVDGTSVASGSLECQPITAGVGFRPYGIQKSFGATSLNYEVRNTVAGAYTGTIYLDDGQVSKTDRVRGVMLDTVYSARVDTAGVVTGENADFLNGNCVFASNYYNCTFNTGVFTVSPNCQYTNAGASQRITYLTDTMNTTSVAWYAQNDGGSNTTAPTSLTCQKSGIDYYNSVAKVLNVTGGWLVDVNIGGANIPSVGSTSYIAWESGSLDMVIRSGSASAKIPCSSTNAPTGLTCSSGSESVGVVFTNPRTGWFKACIYAGGIKGNLSTGVAQLVETLPNSQTIVQEGNSRVTFGEGSSGTQPTSYSQCGNFFFSDVKERAIRFMQEIDNTSAQIWADRSATYGQRDIHITVEPIAENLQASLQGYVSRPNTLNSPLVTALVSITGVVSQETEDFINGNFGVASVSVYTGTYVSGYWKTAPFCWAVPYGTTILSYYSATLETTTTAQYHWQNSSGAEVATAFKYFCIGEKN